MLAKFREFIARGNVIDLAVGIIIGSAFTSVVKSLVDDIVTERRAIRDEVRRLAELLAHA